MRVCLCLCASVCVCVSLCVSFYRWTDEHHTSQWSLGKHSGDENWNCSKKKKAFNLKDKPRDQNDF